LITGLFARFAAFGGLVIITGAWLFKDAYDSLRATAARTSS